MLVGCWLLAVAMWASLKGSPQHGSSATFHLSEPAKEQETASKAEARVLGGLNLRSENPSFYLFIYLFIYFKFLFIYLFIFGCVGSSFLCEGFL